jgi:hypothetical protein
MTNVRTQTLDSLCWPETYTFALRLAPGHNINDQQIFAADRAYSKLRDWAYNYSAGETELHREARWITEMGEYEAMKAAVMVLYNGTAVLGRDYGFVFFEVSVYCGI